MPDPQALGGPPGPGFNLWWPDDSAAEPAVPGGIRPRPPLAASVWGVVRVAAGVGFVLGLISMGSLSQVEKPFVPAVGYLIGVASTTVVSILVALALCLRDWLQTRMLAGQRVNFILRLYFASGWLTVIVWIATAIGLTYLLVIFIIG